MKRIFIFAGAIFAVLLIALAILPFLVPGSVYKAQIEQAASDALGREVTVDGDVSVSLFPVISASVEGVTVANPKGFEEPYMIEAGALRGSVRILPLFARRVEVSELAFEDAQVSLTRLEDGRTNWMLGAGDGVEEDGPGDVGDPFSASIDRAALRNASVVYEDRQANTRYELRELDFETALRAVDEPLSAKANGLFQGQSFSTTLVIATPQSLQENRETEIEFDVGADLGNANFDGTVTLKDPVSIHGRFSMTLPQLQAVSDFLDAELPLDPAPLGALRVRGRVSGTVPALSLTFEALSLSGDGVDMSYLGEVDLAGAPSLDGTLSLALRNAHELAQQMGFEIPQLAPVQQVSLTTRVSGPASGLSFSQIDARTSSPTLTASYRGAFSLAGTGALDGEVSADSDQPGRMLEQMGLASSQDVPVRRFRIRGHASGDLQNLTLADGTYVVGETEATGSLGMDRSRSRPSIKADLSMDQLNLDMFLGEEESNGGGSSSGWSDEPLDLAALNLLDANLSLEAGSVSLGQVELQNAALSAQLTDGILDATLDRFSTFGGDWTGQALINASDSVPQFDFSMSAADVAAGDLLGTLADFRKLTGTGAFRADISSTGISMSQIVNRLNGTLALDLDQGALQGINLGQLVRSAASLTDLTRSNELTLSSLGDVVSPQAETDFTAFQTSLSIRDGIASIEALNLANSVLDVAGTGQINLGGRTLDVKLTPAVDKAGQGEAAVVQLNGVPVPIRISGSWSAPKFSPDFSGVMDAARNELRKSAGQAIGDRLGGELGSIVSGAVSGQADGQAPPAEEEADTGEVETAEPDETEEEETPERAIRDALGRILQPD